MPTYEAICHDCGVVADYLRSVEDRMNTPNCISCGKPMSKAVFSAPRGFVTGKFEPFISHVDGSLITSQREMQEHNIRNNVVNMADGYDNEAVINGTCAVAPEKIDINDIKADIAEATQMVTNGYKPITEVYDGD